MAAYPLRLQRNAFFGTGAPDQLPNVGVGFHFVASLELADSQLRIRASRQLRVRWHPFERGQNAERFGAVVRGRRQVPKQQPLARLGKSCRPAAVTARIPEAGPIGVRNELARIGGWIQRRPKFREMCSKFGQVVQAKARHARPSIRRAFDSSIFS